MESGSKFTFRGREPTVRHMSQTSNDLDSEMGSVEFAAYTVHMPPTPDNQQTEICMERSASQRVKEQYAMNSLFTGGFDSITRAHLMEKVMDSETSHPQMTGVNGSYCSVPGCDSKLMTDERGSDIVFCECDYKICRDCHRDAVRTGDGICPGCKEAYKEKDMDEYDVDNQQPMPLPSSTGTSKMERRLSLMKSKSFRSNSLVRSQSNVFDHDYGQWLFETKGSYGYGNAMWPKDATNGSRDGNDGDLDVLLKKPWKPLTRRLNISAAILSPYR